MKSKKIPSLSASRHTPAVLRWLSLTALLALSTTAGGEEHRVVRLRYAPAPGLGCPEEQAVRDMVSARLGYDPFRPDAAATIAATIRQEGRQLRARVDLQDAAGRSTGGRGLVSKRHDCRELASTMALAISIAIDPLHFAAPVRPPPPPASVPVVVCPPAPEAPTCPVCPAIPPPPPPTPSPRSPSRAVQLRLLGGVLGALGSGPSVALGLRIQVGLRAGDFSIGLEGRSDLPSKSDGPPGHRVEAASLVASLVPCAHIRGFALCALASAGVLRASGVDAEVRRSASAPWVAIGGRIAYELRLYGSLALTAHFDLQGNLIETALRVDAMDAWVAPSLSGALGLGLLGAF